MMTVATLCLVLAFGGVLYFLLGYPLLLRMFPFHKRPVTKDMSCLPTVSIVMAVHNGEAFLKEKLENLLALDYPSDLVQILVVSDGSTDGSDAIAESFTSKGVRLFSLPRGGKAAALNFALAQAEGQILFYCDVRQKLKPDALRHLMANFADEQVGGVTGELRILQSDAEGSEQANLGIYWRYELWARRIQSQIWSLFSATGCIYAMRRTLVQPIPTDTLVDDGEIPLQAYLQGYRIVFDDNAVAVDYPTVQGKELRRRMRTLAGVWQIWARHPRLLLWPHRMWLHFVSHKLGRLLIPWLLVVFGVASVCLPPSPWKVLLLAGELLFVLVAFTAHWVGRRSLLGRITSLAETFVSMNVAALLSPSVFFISPQKLWQSPTQVDRGPASAE